jgi:HSP20 family protein
LVLLWSLPTVFRHAFGPGVAIVEPGQVRDFSPVVDSHRDGDDAVIRIELPGVDAAKDVHVEVQGRHLVISGERRDQHAEESEGRLLREIRYGSFRRTFLLGGNVKPEDVTASYDAGVLTVRVKNAYAEAQGRRIAITTAAPVVTAVEADAESKVEPDVQETQGVEA